MAGAGVTPCVGHEDVETSEVADSRIDRFGHSVSITDIGAECECLGSQFARRPADAVDVDVDEDDARVLGVQVPRQRKSDALRRAGDEGGTAA